MLDQKIYDLPVPILDFQNALLEREQDFRDEVITANNLFMDEATGNMTLKKGVFDYSEHPLQPQALSLISSRLKIPTGYLTRCPSKLRATNVNHWLGELKSKKLLLRFDQENIRAILSERYQPVSNLQVISQVVDHFADSGLLENIKIRFQVTALRMIAQVIIEKDQSPVDTCFSGLHLANSETGFSTLVLKALIYRLICKNGLVVPADTISGWRKIHLSKNLLENFNQQITVAVSSLPDVIDKFQLSRNIQIAKPENIIYNIGKKYDLSKEAILTVYDIWNSRSRDQTQFDLINVFTHAGSHNNNLSLEVKEKLQNIGGRLLNFKPEQFSKLARAA